MKLISILFIVLLAGCATHKQSRLTKAAISPLNDFNVVKEEIPEILDKSRKDPYFYVAGQSCDLTQDEVTQLDEVLDADIGDKSADVEKSLLDKGEEAVLSGAENTVVGAIQRTTEGLVPFRSWVRKLSGAERYSKKFASAMAAGASRRSFLKGILAEKSCEHKVKVGENNEK